MSDLFGKKQHLGIKDMIHLHDAVGPAEFFEFVLQTLSFVITTSFHGTAFKL